ncbi:MAG: TonB family protein [Telluria sp.]
MFSTKPGALVAAVLLSLSAVPATAAGAPAARMEASCEKPFFPARWQHDGDGASVVVGYLVGPDGKVVDSKIVQSSGLAYIDRASERAGARCTFVPAEGGARDPAWTRVKYSWVVN